MGGRPVGIVASQPRRLGGILDNDSADKAAHFVTLCDAFGIPLVFLVDVPGFMVGTKVELIAAYRGLIDVYTAARNAMIDDVSDPRETRPTIIRALEMADGKRGAAAVEEARGDAGVRLGAIHPAAATGFARSAAGRDPRIAAPIFDHAGQRRGRDRRRGDADRILQRAPSKATIAAVSEAARGV